MVYRMSLVLLAMVFLVAHADGHAQTEWVGIVEPVDGYSTCMWGETHQTADPCNLEIGLLKSSTLDLDESVAAAQDLVRDLTSRDPLGDRHLVLRPSSPRVHRDLPYRRLELVGVAALG